MTKLLEELEQVKYDLAHLTEFAIAYFQRLLDKYGKGKERRTEIASFETIAAAKVVANNAKLYIDRKEGFIGTSLKKEEYICDCSDIADIIVFKKDGTFQVSRIGDKVFVGKGIIHAQVWKKGDERTTYNMVYVNAENGRAMAKRFNVAAITRDKPYELTKGGKRSKMLYFQAHLNGEAETVQIQLSPGSAAKKKVFEYDFGELAIKGRGAGGNVLTKYPVKKISQVSIGKSTLGAIKIWIDEVSGRLNKEERGKYLGEFDTGDNILAIYSNGTYELKEPEMGSKIEMTGKIEVSKINSDTAISAIHWIGDKGWSMVKRFNIETNTFNERFKFISESGGSKLFYATTAHPPVVTYTYKAGGKRHEVELNMADFIDVKGWKAMGNKLGEFKVLSAKGHKVAAAEKPKKEEPTKEAAQKAADNQSDSDESLKPGDTIELDF